MKKSFLAIFAAAALFSSCEDDTLSVDGGCKEAFNFTSGALIVNEGSFSGTGSISHLDLESGSVSNFIYEKANCDVPAGGVLQSAYVNNSKGYIVANNSQSVHVVNLASFENMKSLEFSYPRYMAFKNDFGYVSNGNYAGKIYKFATGSSSVVDSVSVGDGPESILATDTYIISPNSGGWGVDSTISFVSIAGFEVDTTVTLDAKPKDVVLDKNGKLWVVTSGLGNWDVNGPTAPKLFKVDLSTKVIEASYVIGNAAHSASKLALNAAGDVIFVLKSDGILSFNIDGSNDGDPVLIPGSFYGVNVNPSNDNVFAFDAKDYTSNGSVHVYSALGDSITTYQVGVAPNGAIFK